ncbi:class I SAM-dependent methyltransferase [Hankyongella ginsenosidimutans]|nr:class I SAM-dependent methyltransferase [Hankyongella ginsenosidimutans]
MLKRALAGGMSEDLRRYAPATARNREPILAVLKTCCRRAAWF